MSVVTRIAPSPTGDPHVGTAYIGLFNYVFTRKHGGTFILRIEDTDRERYSAESEARIFGALRWLGLTPDESPDQGGDNGPYRQSERLDIYKKHAYELVDKGTLYPCFCSEERLAEMRAEQKRRKQPLGYDGRCRSIAPDEAKARMDAGEPHALRLKAPLTGETNFKDELRGLVRFANADIRDGVMLKSDGYPTYHLANVIDDHLMGVTHVMRAEEWITSTPIHVLLYEGFGWEVPKFAHLPLLRNPDENKTKISKRKMNTSLDAYREQGIVPEALLNFLGNMGWSMPDGREFFGLDDMTQQFDTSRISLGGPVFDLKKLRFFNARYIRELLSLEDVAERTEPFLKDAGLTWDDEDYLLDVIDVLTPRVETLAEFAEHDYFFREDFSYDAKAKKNLAAGQKYLEDLEREFARLDSFDEDSIDDMLRGYVQSQSVGMGKVLQPLRAALTGVSNSPGINELVSVLGQQKVLKRIGRALTAITAGLPDDNPSAEDAGQDSKDPKSSEVA